MDELYKGFDDPKFAADLAKYDEMIAKINEFAAKISDMQPLDALKTYIAGSESSMQLLTDMYSYAMLRSSVNTKDTEAASISGRLMAKMKCNNKGGNDNQKCSFPKFRTLMSLSSPIPC